MNSDYSKLRVAGITKFTTIDYPGKMSMVVFIQGCPWRCCYCQNNWMQSREFHPEYLHSSWNEVESLLKRRSGILEAVVFSGGEPCTDPVLLSAIKRAKEFGYNIGLHTAGIYPNKIKELIPHLDWIGLDVKACPTNHKLYDNITKVNQSSERFLESYRYIKKSGIKVEFRTTAGLNFLSENDLIDLANWYKEENISNPILQLCRDLNDITKVASYNKIPDIFTVRK